MRYGRAVEGDPLTAPKPSRYCFCWYKADYVRPERVRYAEGPHAQCTVTTQFQPVMFGAYFQNDDISGPLGIQDYRTTLCNISSSMNPFHFLSI